MAPNPRLILLVRHSLGDGGRIRPTGIRPSRARSARPTISEFLPFRFGEHFGQVVRVCMVILLRGLAFGSAVFRSIFAEGVLVRRFPIRAG